METAYLDTPIGFLELAAGETGIKRIQFLDTPPEADASAHPDNKHLASLIEQLIQYFRGNSIRFDCELDWDGTAFQKRVWQALLGIPYGKTESYGQVAARIGQPKAARAVGTANNRNPIPIVVPCHRVIGASQKMVGFGGGIWRKQWLLEHEGLALPLSH